MAGKVILYTDGACKGNPGPGGWGVVLRYGDSRKTLHGGEAGTTNNRTIFVGFRILFCKLLGSWSLGVPIG